MADLLPKTATSESARKALNAKTSNLPSLKQTAENAGEALSGNVDLQSNVKKVPHPHPSPRYDWQQMLAGSCLFVSCTAVATMTGVALLISLHDLSLSMLSQIAVVTGGTGRLVRP
jgi:hypothetical protein